MGVTPANRSKWEPLLVCIVLAAAVWIVFGQTARYGFVNYDDPAYSNPIIAKGLTADGLRFAFTYGEIGHWHPLTWISHMLDFQMFGRLHPGGHHVTNILLHTASVIILFLVFWRMTAAIWPSALVASVFAVHPLRVESVAWIAERKDVLSALFFVLTLAAYVWYVRRKSAARYSVVIAAYALGLMSKNMLLTTPLILLLIDHWPLGRTGLRQLIVEKIPLAVLSVVSAVITLLVPEQIPATERLPAATRIANAIVTPVVYLRQTFVPTRLAVYYPPPSGGVPVWQTVGALAVILAVSAVVILSRKRAPYLITGWLWYLVMLMPVIGIVQISNYAHADRYTYLPQIGISLMIAWGLAQMTADGVVAAFAAIVTVAMVWLAYRQTTVWRDSATLWRHALGATGGNAVAYHGLGAAVGDEGDHVSAIRYLRDAIQEDPTYFPAHDRLGEELVAVGRPGEAIPQFAETVRLWPSYAIGHYDLASALVDTGRPDEAIPHVQRALELRPRYAEARVTWGNALMRKGEPQLAAEQYRLALEQNPHSAIAVANLGNALAASGKLEEGVSYLREAVGADPQDPEVHVQLGNAYLLLNKTPDAIDEYRAAIRLRPNLAEAHTHLGIALAEAGQRPQGVDEYKLALRLAPNDAEAHLNLGLAMAASGDAGGAIEQYRFAIASRPDYVDAYVCLGSAIALRHEPAEAIRYLETAVQLDHGRNPSIYDRLAAVYAMSGRFSDAARTATAGAAVADAHGDASLSRSLREDAQSYEARAGAR